MARLTAEQWRAIRQVWEFDPDQPSYAEAARAAAARHGFAPPSKVAVGNRARAENWERRGSLSGINQAAHRIADRMGARPPSGAPGVQGGGTAYRDPAAKPDSLSAEYEERREAELKRAEIRLRHRQEWAQVAKLRQEALQVRSDDPDQAFLRLKLAKIAAETTSIQQAGECRAWGMDELIDPARLKSLSDAQLEALVAGKSAS